MDVASYNYDFVEFLCQKETDIFSLLRMNNLSERFIKNIYHKNLIEVNSNSPAINGSLNIGDMIRIYYEEEVIGYKSLDEKLDIVFENENYLVINKAANMAVHPTFSRQSGTLLEEIGSYFKKNNINRRVRLINRLDLETSGLILVSKNPLFQQQVSLILSNGGVKKKYVAIVEGNINCEGWIEKCISRDPNFPIKRIIDNNGQEAITKYRPILVNKDYSFLEVFPITGRTHQIRVHLASIGHPIVGDKLYGNKSNLISRCALHSKSVEFLDPFTNKVVKYEIRLPHDMEVLI